jgi:hypothetical protein
VRPGAISHALANLFHWCSVMRCTFVLSLFHSFSTDSQPTPLAFQPHSTAEHANSGKLKGSFDLRALGLSLCKVRDATTVTLLLKTKKKLEPTEMVLKAATAEHVRVI